MVEFLPETHVAERMERLQAARAATQARLGGPPDGVRLSYWERWFEEHAGEVLARFPEVRLREGKVVRYRFFGQQGRDLRVRPYVAEKSFADLRPHAWLEWVPAPDSRDARERAAPTQDVALLYRHWSFPRTAAGVFDYWLVLQELWGSMRWAHSQLVASEARFQALTSTPEWTVRQPPERFEPAVALGANQAHLAVLLFCPLEQFQVTLQRIEIDDQQALRYEDAILVASGPRGYRL